MKRPAAAAPLILTILTLAGPMARAQGPHPCMTCHADTGLVLNEAAGRPRSAYVDTTLIAGSMHAGLQCIDCHTDAVGEPHPENLKPVDCGACHSDAMRGFRTGVHGKALDAGDPDAPRCSTCHGTHGIMAAVDTLSTIHPLRQPATCAGCHGREDFIQRHRLPGALPAAQYARSVHNRALRAGVAGAPSCSDCHRAHDILPPSDPASPINRANVQNTCGSCHSDIAQIYAGSIHGERVGQGYASAPSCNSCHGEHNIQSPSREEAATNPTRVAREVCQPCHASVVLNQNFGLPTNRVSTYFSTYHGLAVARGSKVAANCTSCHGVHDIYATYDQRSKVHPANLDGTCGRCHPGAREDFSRTPVHGQARAEAPDAVGIISLIYIILIVLILSAMVAHNLIIYSGFVVAKYRKYRSVRTVRRFSLNMILQHLVLLLAFTILAVTGFALKFPGVFQVLGALGLDEPMRSVVHRAAATVLVAGGLYHLYWLLFRRRGKIEFRAMIPAPKDLADAAGLMRYYLRLAPEKPKLGRYSYIEKAEYWALLWGTVIMSLTGFVLWFPIPAAHLLGSWAVPVATAIHYYEAILATLSIVVWHLFFTIFHPDEYPMSLVWLNGRVSEEEVQEHRPLWHEDLEQQRLADEMEEPGGPSEPEGPQGPA